MKKTVSLFLCLLLALALIPSVSFAETEKAYQLSAAAPADKDKCIIAAFDGTDYYALTTADVNAATSAGSKLTVASGKVSAPSTDVLWTVGAGSSTNGGVTSEGLGFVANTTTGACLHLNSSKIRVATTWQNGVFSFAAVSGVDNAFTVKGEVNGRYLTFDASSKKFGVSDAAASAANIYFFIEKDVVAAPAADELIVTSISKYGNCMTSMTVDAFNALAAGYELGDILEVELPNGTKVEVPYVSNYSDVDAGAAAILGCVKDGVISLAINMGNFATTYGVTLEEGVDYVVKVSMKEKKGYYDEYLIHQLSRSDVRADYPDLTDAQFANFREITLGNIVAGVFYRSSSPVNNEIARAAYADDCIEAAKVQLAMNMADNDEAIAGYFAAEDFDSPYYKSLYEADKVIPLNMGVDFSADAFKESLAKGFIFLIDNPGSFVVHCNEGKDRAGFASAILECLGDATLAEVKADYMVTYFNYYGVTEGTDQYNAVVKSNIVKTLCTAFGAADEEALAALNLHDAAVAYLQDCGMTEGQIEKLYSKLTGALKSFTLIAPVAYTDAVLETINEVTYIRVDIKLEGDGLFTDAFISALHFELGYDDSKLTYVEYLSNLAGTTAGGNTVWAVNAKDGLIKASVASTYGAKTDGSLISLYFLPTEAAVNGDVIPLILSAPELSMVDAANKIIPDAEIAIYGQNGQLIYGAEVDKSALQAEYDKDKGLYDGALVTDTDPNDLPDGTVYLTVANGKIDSDALAAALAVLNDDNATQEEVNAALLALQNAFIAPSTVAVKVSGLETALNSAIAFVYQLDANGRIITVTVVGPDGQPVQVPQYTKEFEACSEGLQQKWLDAIANGQNVLGNQAHTQNQVDAATNALNNLRKTGESTVVFVFAGLAVLAAAGLAVTLRRRRSF